MALEMPLDDECSRSHSSPFGPVWCYSHLGGSVDERRPVYFMVAQKQREDERRLRVPNILFKGMS